MSTSAFAGNVLLVDLHDLQQRGWLDADELLNAPVRDEHRIRFGDVVPYRMAKLARAAQAFQDRANAGERAEFDAFCDHHANWLHDYALFMSLANAFGWRDWCDWDEPLRRRDPASLAAAAREHASHLQFWKFCQWSFFRQWGALKAYANQRGVEIIGDAPIFIAFQSADVWAHQHLFELDTHGRAQVVAGVPPDAFSATGQRWGNPLYRWSVHAEDGFAWWVERIRRTFELVDIVRIDHFRGFAAYWEIPADEPTAVKGRWCAAPGEALFKAVAKALGPLPIIAEDLGVITPDVVALRKRFAFPGMRILQFAFGGGSDNIYLPHNHEADSVVYTGTHDNDTTLGWWNGIDEATRSHVRSYLASPAHEVHWDLMRAASASVADTVIHPMQDVLGLGGEHRMNFPGQPEGYWEWRFSWAQVNAEHASRLRMLCTLYGRDGRAESAVTSRAAPQA
jgi:4-alpha-glucanotransferase